MSAPSKETIAREAAENWMDTAYGKKHTIGRAEILKHLTNHFQSAINKATEEQLDQNRKLSRTCFDLREENAELASRECSCEVFKGDQGCPVHGMVTAAQPQEWTQLVDALRKARETIHALHGDVAWEIYEKHSPEMKQIDAALANTPH